MTTKWSVECWNCDGEGVTFSCMDGCCEDADIGCDQCEFSCEVCNGKGAYIERSLPTIITTVLFQ